MNPITDKQLEMIKKVELILSIKFKGNSKQDAYLWLKEYVPLAEDEYRNLTTQKQHDKPSPTSVHKALDYSYNSGSSKMLRLMEIDKKLKLPYDLDDLDQMIVELVHNLDINSRRTT